MSPLLVENAVKHFRQGDRQTTALQAISLQVAAGEFWAIMGASGSGKSTLLHLIAGLTRPDSGRIIVAGKDLALMNDKQLTLFRRRQIGLVFQSFNLIPTLTAQENIALPLMLDGQNGHASRDKVGRLMESLHLSARADHRPDALSGGEQQRVAIGRALITDPAIILADEPTGNLDSANGQSVCQLLRELSVVHGKTIVMVTHEPAVAAYAGNTIILKDGKRIDSTSSAPTGPSFCPSCHSILAADAAFCHRCGNRSH